MARFMDDAKVALMIANGGFVGINTSSPMEQLHVEGAILAQDVLPITCNTYDLGSSTQRWRDLYLSGNTIDMEGLRLSRGANDSLIIGSNTEYATTLRYPGYCNILEPAVDGRINGVNVTALHRRTKASYADAMEATSVWNVRTPPADNDWRGVCWAPEKSLFVAVGGPNPLNENKNVMTSSDGMNWTLQTAASNLIWSDVCWAAERSLFVAIAASTTALSNIMTSPDGFTWTSQSTGQIGVLNTICWSPQLGMFAVGGTNRLATSADGISWTQVSITTTSISSICWSPERKMFVGVAFVGTQRVLVSYDGISWTPRPSADDTTQWREVCWSPELGKFVAVSSDSSTTKMKVMTSSDGLSWTLYPSANDAYTWRTVIWSPQLSVFIAIDNNGNMMTSQDGTMWKLIPKPSNAEGTFLSMCWSPELSMFVTVSTGNTFMTSKPLLPASKSVVLANPSHIIVNSMSGNVGIGTTTGIDGRLRVEGMIQSHSILPISCNVYDLGSSTHRWRDLYLSGTTINMEGLRLSRGSSNGFVVGSDAEYATTLRRPGYCNILEPAVDGFINGVNLTALHRRTKTSYADAIEATSTWIVRTPPADKNWQGVCWAPEKSLFVAVGGLDSLGENKNVMTSSDGMNWTLQTVSSNLLWNDVCWAPEKSMFVAIAASSSALSNIMTSPDGLTWTSQSTGQMGSLFSICWSPHREMFVVAGTNRIATSKDGANWTQFSISSTTISSMCWSPERKMFVGVASSGAQRVIVSYDGISWTPRPSADDTTLWSDVCWSPELAKFVAVSSDISTTKPKIMSSNDGLSWTLHSSAQDAYKWRSVVWSPQLSMLVAIADNGNIMTSQDGTIWDLIVTPSNAVGFYLSMCWSPELSMFVAISSGTTFMTSKPALPASKSSVLANPSHITVNPISGNVGIGTTTGIDGRLRVEGLIQSHSLMPVSCNVYDLGSSTQRWRDLYLSGNTIDMEGLRLSRGASDSLIIGSNTSYTTTLRYPGYCNIVEPAVDGRINGVNITALHRRTKTSYAYVQEAASTLTLRAAVEDTPFHSVCWSPELAMFLAVGESKFMISYNGISWQPVTPPAPNLWWPSVAWSPQLSLFVAVASSGTQRVAWSSNGTTWSFSTSADINTQQWKSVCWSPELGVFVAVARSVDTTNRVMKSSDGKTWTVYSTPGDNFNWLSICWSAELSLFVAVSVNYVMTSVDGETWESVTIPNSNVMSVCWSPELGMFLAVGADSTITSYDGKAWQLRDISSTLAEGSATSVIWSPELSVFILSALGSTASNPHIAISPDGINWEGKLTTTNGAIAKWSSLCWSPMLSMFVALSASGGPQSTRILTSKPVLPAPKSVVMANPSHVTVSATTGNVGIGTANPIRKLHVVGDINFTGSLLQNGSPYVATSSSSSTTTLTRAQQLNALTPWRTVSSFIFNALEWSPYLGIFVAVAYYEIFTSPDGLTWTSRTTSGVDWKSVVWSPELSMFVAVGVVVSWQTSGGINYDMAMSNDGITWGFSASYFPSDVIKEIQTQVSWMSVCWSAERNLFVAVGFSTNYEFLIAVSNDGSNWIRVAAPSSAYSWYSVCWAKEPGLFVAVGSGGTEHVMTSSDGYNWTQHNVGLDAYLWSSVSWSSKLNRFIAVGYNTSVTSGSLITSTNGTIWSEVSIGALGANQWTYVTWAPDIAAFVAVSQTGSHEIIVSLDGTSWSERSSGNRKAWTFITWSPQLSRFVGAALSDTFVLTSAPALPTSENTILAPNQDTVTVLENGTLQVSAAVRAPAIGGNRSLFIYSSTTAGEAPVNTNFNDFTFTSKLNQLNLSFANGSNITLPPGDYMIDAGSAFAACGDSFIAVRDSSNTVLAASSDQNSGATSATVWCALKNYISLAVTTTIKLSYRVTNIGNLGRVPASNTTQLVHRYIEITKI